MKYASPFTEQRRVCSSVAPAGWCGLLAPESRVKEAATWCQVAARITVTAATTGQLDTCSLHRVHRTPSRVDNVNLGEKITYTNINGYLDIQQSISYR